MSKTHHTIISAANRACEKGKGEGGSNAINSNVYRHGGSEDAQVGAPLSAEKKFTKIRTGNLNVGKGSSQVEEVWNESTFSPLVNISKLMEEQQQQKSAAPAMKKAAPTINPNVSSNLSFLNKKYRYEEDKTQQDKGSSDFHKTFAGGIYGQLLSNRYQSQRETCACDVCQALNVTKKNANPSNKGGGKAPQQPVWVRCAKNEAATQYTKKRYAALERAYAEYLHRSHLKSKGCATSKEKDS